MRNKHTLLLRNILNDPCELECAALILKNGGLVVFPTETVYGLGANAFDEDAAASIFKAKGRPGDNPLIVHILSIKDLSTVAKNIPSSALQLFETFSPGPFTIVLAKNKAVPAIVTAGLDTVAVRIPSHPIARLLLEKSGLPIAAPSANRSGRPSPTTFDMAVMEMKGRVDAIIDGGSCEVGLESTVVSIPDEQIKILRPGAVTEEMIRVVLGSKNPLIQEASGSHAKPSSPGMKYAHYQPKAPVYLAEHWKNVKVNKLFGDRKIGVIHLSFDIPPSENREQISFSSLADYAKNLYKTLVDLDQMGVEIIIAQAVEEKGIGRAIMNRLEKASGGKTV
jgi:L-threonylcarbamoyladenylate synthase